MWFIIALLVGAGVTGLAMWMRSSGMNTKWYDWVIGIVGILLLLFTIQNFFGSGLEGEAEAGRMFLLVTGIPSLILLGISGQFLWRHSHAES